MMLMMIYMVRKVSISMEYNNKRNNNNNNNTTTTQRWTTSLFGVLGAPSGRRTDRICQCPSFHTFRQDLCSSSTLSDTVSDFLETMRSSSIALLPNALALALALALATIAASSAFVVTAPPLSPSLAATATSLIIRRSMSATPPIPATAAAVPVVQGQTILFVECGAYSTGSHLSMTGVLIRNQLSNMEQQPCCVRTHT
jgi:hypothetical protein